MSRDICFWNESGAAKIARSGENWKIEEADGRFRGWARARDQNDKSLINRR
jgi:hypothetical protein